MRPPTTLIVLGYSHDAAQRLFETCDRAGQITNHYRVENEEYQRDIFVCRRPRQPWPALWERLKRFG